jgi:hypothetical protein
MNFLIMTIVGDQSAVLSFVLEGESINMVQWLYY